MGVGVLVSSFSFFGIEASAGEKWISNGSHGFTDSWSDVEYGDDWTMKYGYNTTWINEDWTHTKHPDIATTAKVKNSNGTHVGSKAGSGNWSKIEVRHSGTSLSYGIEVHR